MRESQESKKKNAKVKAPFKREMAKRRNIRRDNNNGRKEIDEQMGRSGSSFD